MNYSLDNSNPILPSQYSDLIRRRSFALDAEHRLSWAVLEDALGSYLANQACATAKQQRAFAEVNAWFHSAAHETRGLFAFESICDFLAIDSAKLLKALESIRARGSPRDHQFPGVSPVHEAAPAGCVNSPSCTLGGWTEMGRCIAIEAARARRPARFDVLPRARLKGIKEMPRMRLRREHPAIWWSLTAWLWHRFKQKRPKGPRPMRHVPWHQRHRDGKR